MKKLNSRIAAALFGMIVLATAGVAQSEAPANPIARPLTVTGMIEPVADPLFGATTPVQIVSADAGTFLVANEGVGKDLRAHVGVKVTVVAKPEADVDGKPLLRVLRYELHES